MVREGESEEGKERQRREKDHSRRCQVLSTASTDQIYHYPQQSLSLLICLFFPPQWVNPICCINMGQTYFLMIKD